MSLEFPFEYADVEGLGRLFYPIVILKVKTIFGWKKFKFLVDTGADITTIPVHIFPILGLEKSRLKTSYALGVGGYSIKSWEFQLPVRIGVTELRILASVVETKNDSMPLLLGRKDIFEERFNLFLDSKNKVTVISENKCVGDGP